MPQPLYCDGQVLRVLDQTRLPHDEVVLELSSTDALIEAIDRLVVRGAPLLGVAGGYGVALAAARGEDVATAATRLAGTRPTAVNLSTMVRRVERAAEDGPGAALAEARSIEQEEADASAAIARHGAGRLAGLGGRLMTHCNAGALAVGTGGTALAVITELAASERVRVLVPETRPLLQGARLTAYELSRAGIAHALCVDGAAAGLIARGEVDAVVVGCDRVARNGDVANKVGTYSHALAARAAGIPFFVAGPISSIDPETPDGASIAIEERPGDEVRGTAADPRTPVRNPAFDVTPAALVTALVTDRGVAEPVTEGSVAALLAR